MKKVFVVGALAALATGAVLLAAPQNQPAAQPKLPAPKSQAEGQALQGIFQAMDADTRLKLADDFLAKFPDSDYKSTVSMAMAETYRQKNDYANTIIYGDRALEADPNNYMAMLLLATTIAQRTREFDMDREEKLGRVEKLASSAMENLKTAVKPNPAMSDEQWAGAKSMFQAQAHEALAMAAVARKKHDTAIAEFKTAIGLTVPPDPTTEARLGAEYIEAKMYDDAIATFDKVIATPELHPQIKAFAEAQKKRALQKKGEGAKPEAAPATPAAPSAAPAPAEPKKP